MGFGSRTDESWWMWSVVAQRKAGSPVASVVASEDVDTPRQCLRGPWDLDSMRHPDQVDTAADFGAVLAAEDSVEDTAVTVSVVLVEVSATKEAAMVLVGRRPRMLLLALVVDAAVDSAVEADSIVVLPAATGSLYDLAMPSRTVVMTVTVTVMGTATEIVTVCLTACLTAVETAIVTVTVTATDMAAARIMGGSDTARMMLATMTRARGDDTKCPLSLFLSRILSFPFSALIRWWVSLFCSLHNPFFRKGKGVRREPMRTEEVLNTGYERGFSTHATTSYPGHLRGCTFAIWHAYILQGVPEFPTVSVSPILCLYQGFPLGALHFVTCVSVSLSPQDSFSRGVSMYSS